MALLHEEITEKILEASFEVAKELGTGFLEAVYEKSLQVALEQKEFKVQTQIPVSVYFRGLVVGQYVCDLLVNDLVIVELKTVRALMPEHLAQVINYLKATRMDVGMLINFGRPKIEYRRLHREP